MIVIFFLFSLPTLFFYFVSYLLLYLLYFYSLSRALLSFYYFTLLFYQFFSSTSPSFQLNWSLNLSSCILLLLFLSFFVFKVQSVSFPFLFFSFLSSLYNIFSFLSYISISIRDDKRKRWEDGSQYIIKLAIVRLTPHERCSNPMSTSQHSVIYIATNISNTYVADLFYIIKEKKHWKYKVIFLYSPSNNAFYVFFLWH